MKFKKFMALGLVASMACMMLTGCMGQIGEITINEDGSGFVTASVGMTKEFIDSMSETGTAQEGVDYVNSFSHNGITYYGETQSESFANLDELNEMLNSENEADIDTGLMSVVQNDDKTFTLTLNATPETGDTTEVENSISESDETISKEELEVLMSQMCMVFKFNFPTTVTQVSGPTDGIVIEGNKLEMDIIAMGMNITEPTTFVFTTATYDTTVPPTEEPEVTHPVIVSEFTDVAADAWYFNAVNAMAKGGLVAGVGDNKFNPEGTLTVAQFCQILARAKNMTTGADESGYWAALAVKNCIDAGYIFSAGEVTSANYDVAITREAAVAAMYLAKQSGLFLPERNLTAVDIPDYAQISEQYQENIMNAFNYGITDGIDEAHTFNPQGLLTRGQVCQLFYNLEWTSPLDDVTTPVPLPEIAPELIVA